MIIISSDLTIPKAQLNELKSLDIASLKDLLQNLIDIVKDIEFDGCDSTTTNFDYWVKTLRKSEVIKLSYYVLSILDYLIEED